MIKAVIFDFDGTLMDTLPGISSFCNKGLKAVGLPPIETEKFKYFVGNGRDLLIHRILEYYNNDTPENYEIAGKIYDDEYEKDILFGTVVYDGIRELLKTLKDKGIKIGILTNKPHNVAVNIIETVFPDTFDIYFGQREGVPTKPSPDGALEIAKELGLDPAECAFVGDTIVDVTTGINAGMYAIGVLWGFRKKEELMAANAIVDKPFKIYETIKNLK